MKRTLFVLLILIVLFVAVSAVLAQGAIVTSPSTSSSVALGWTPPPIIDTPQPPYDPCWGAKEWCTPSLP